VPKLVSSSNPSVEGPMRGLVLGELRHVQKHSLGRAEHCRLRERRGSRRTGRQVVSLPVLADCLNAAGVGIGDGDEPQRDGAAIVRERYDIRRIERQPR